MSDDNVLGYVLVNRNTGEMDWDGRIHDRRTATANAVQAALGDNPLDESRPEDLDDRFEYDLCAVVRVPEADAEILREALRAWDREEQSWRRLTEDSA